MMMRKCYGADEKQGKHWRLKSVGQDVAVYMLFRSSEEITKKEKLFVSQEGMVVALNNKFSKHCVMCFIF